ncbi:hypothetical protein GB998_16055 [Lactobacillus plantarum]|nr:hypothetical protein [Lactiplantibacillus plantarum]
MVGLFVMPSSTIFRQHTRLNAATNKTTKKISHTRRSPKDRNYPSTPFDKLPKYFILIKIRACSISYV